MVEDRRGGLSAGKMAGLGKSRVRRPVNSNRDDYFMSKAAQAAEESRCKKRQLGCVLVIKHWGYGDEIIPGWNGAPKPLEACQECPRAGLEHGANLHLCRAVHAERAVLLTAARRGISTQGTILYSDMGAPCKECMLELIAAGVREIVVSKGSFYDEASKGIIYEWTQKGGIYRIHDNGVLCGDTGMTQEELNFNNSMQEYLARKLESKIGDEK